MTSNFKDSFLCVDEMVILVDEFIANRNTT